MRTCLCVYEGHEAFTVVDPDRKHWLGIAGIGIAYVISWKIGIIHI